ncbi:MAG: sialidase family protein [Chthoniobacteraceae bacterium]
MNVLLICLIAFAFAAHAAPGNAVVLNVEPTAEFPRNSEGSFVTLKSGRVLHFYTQFYGGAADHSAARIVAVQSEDAGRSWDAKPRTVVENRGGANVMSVSLLRLKSGRIALFYLLKNSWIDCRPHVVFSDDEALTWSEPKLMMAAPGYFVMNNDRVIQHSSGRLLAPLAFHRARGTDPESSRSFDSRSIALWLVSDDDGQTWAEAPQWLALPVPATRTGLQEPGIVELADGSLLSWFRTDQGAQFETRSSDVGRTWTPIVAGEMKSPASPASIERLPGSGDLLSLWNDHGGQFPMVKGKRTPLVAALSSDGGKTWPRRKLIEGDPDGWYCYTAIHFVDGAVLLAYCAGDSKVGGLNRLRIRRIELDWFAP